MNCITFSGTEYGLLISVLSFRLAHKRARKEMFFEISLSCFWESYPHIKEVFSLSAVTKRAIMLAVRISATKATPNPQLG